MSQATQPLRVLLVSANYKPSIGGIERYVENLAHGLAARGHRVTVAACRTDGGVKLEQDGDVDGVAHPPAQAPRPILRPGRLEAPWRRRQGRAPAC